MERTVAPDWLMRCRLCAKENHQANINIFCKHNQKILSGTAPVFGGCQELTLKAAIEKLLWVNIERKDDLPEMICAECFSTVTSMVNFAERVSRVQQMFNALHSCSANTKSDLQTARLKYGLLDEDCENVLTQQHLTEVDYFEEKPIIIKLEEHITEEDQITTNLMEQPSIQLEIKSENIIQGEYVADKSDGFAYKVQESADCSDDEEFLVICNSEKISSYEVACLEATPSSNQGGDPLFAPDEPITISSSETSETTTSIEDMLEENEFQVSMKSIEDASALSEDDTELSAERKPGNVSPAICEKCGKSVQSTAALQQHMLKHMPYPPFECDVCNKVFKLKEGLKNHMETHDHKKHICPYCGLELNSRATLHHHLLVHSDVKNHKCDYCERAFKRSKGLKRHLLIHTGLKPYVCDFCSHAFSTANNCRSHKRRSHPVELAAVDASGGGNTTTQDILRLEELKALSKVADKLTPVGVKRSVPNPLICKECGVQFKTRSSYYKHMVVVHSDEKKHKCDYCGSAFKLSTKLKSHLLLHTGLKPYVCNFCGKAFSSGSNCRYHKKRLHPKELAALEAAGGKTYTHNIPKLAELRAMAKAAAAMGPTPFGH